MMKMVMRAALLAAVWSSSSFALVGFGGGVGFGMWNAGATGDIAYGSGTPTVVDMEDTLGLEAENNNYMWAYFEHPIPVVPNIRVEQTAFFNEGTETLTVGSSFGGQTFTGKTKSELQLNQTDAILYWGIPGLNTLTLGILDFDFGLALKQFDGYLKMTETSTNTTEEADLSFPMPLVYLRLMVNIPVIDLGIEAQSKTFSYGGVSYGDTRIGLSYELPIPIPIVSFGIEGGLRTQNFVIDPDSDLVDDVDADLSFSGVYYGLSASF